MIIHFFQKVNGNYKNPPLWGFNFQIKQLLIFMNRVRPLNRLLLQPHLMQEHTPRKQSGMIPVKFGHRDMQSEIGMMGHMVM